MTSNSDGPPPATSSNDPSTNPSMKGPIDPIKGTYAVSNGRTITASDTADTINNIPAAPVAVINRDITSRNFEIQERELPSTETNQFTYDEDSTPKARNRDNISPTTGSYYELSQVQNTSESGQDEASESADNEEDDHADEDSQKVDDSDSTIEGKEERGNEAKRLNQREFNAKRTTKKQRDIQIENKDVKPVIATRNGGIARPIHYGGTQGTFSLQEATEDVPEADVHSSNKFLGLFGQHATRNFDRRLKQIMEGEDPTTDHRNARIEKLDQDLRSKVKIESETVKRPLLTRTKRKSSSETKEMKEKKDKANLMPPNTNKSPRKQPKTPRRQRKARGEQIDVDKDDWELEPSPSLDHDPARQKRRSLPTHRGSLSKRGRLTVDSRRNSNSSHINSATSSNNYSGGGPRSVRIVDRGYERRDESHSEETSPVRGRKSYQTNGTGHDRVRSESSHVNRATPETPTRTSRPTDSECPKPQNLNRALPGTLTRTSVPLDMDRLEPQNLSTSQGRRNNNLLYRSSAPDLGMDRNRSRTPVRPGPPQVHTSRIEHVRNIDRASHQNGSVEHDRVNAHSRTTGVGRSTTSDNPTRPRQTRNESDKQDSAGRKDNHHRYRDE